MYHILLGNTAPIELKRREVPPDPEEAREMLRTLAPDQTDEWHAAQSDEQVAERVAEFRVPTNLRTVNGQSITEIKVPDGTSLIEAVGLIKKVWVTQSTESPAWVEADDTEVAAILAKEFGCSTKCPSDWMHADGKPPWRAFPGLTMLMGLTFAVVLFMATRMALRTDAGADFQSRVMGDGTEATAGTGNMRPGDYLAITEDATTPDAADTTLSGELAAGGLERAQATYAHTAAATTYTLVYQWTSSDGTPRTINKMGVFNASSSGTMVFESLVPSPPTLVAGDKLEITSTVDIS